MKRLSFVLVVFLVSLLMTNSAPAVDFNEVVMEDGVYKWSNTSNWMGTYPDGTVEVKIRKSDTGIGDTCTLDSVENWPAGDQTRMRVYEGATLDIVTGGSLKGPGWVRIGESGSGTVNQTGGLFEVRKGNDDSRLVLGDAKTNSDGLYHITGGTMTYDKTDGGGGMLIIGDRGGIGHLKVDGSGGTIDMGSLRVGGRESGRGAEATLEFNLTSSVSPIQVGYTTIDPDGDDHDADLIVTATVAPTAYVLLVDNSSATAVDGYFDSVSLTNLGAYTFLTYKYDSASQTWGTGNDIALVPEPATLVLLGLGSLVALRRKK